MRRQTARDRRMIIWFCLNAIIFIACYLNYRLQLKHRYLYKTLNVGLCLSRAAAMVINFNLLLVWLPMCKYSLTRLACLANHSSRGLQLQHQNQSSLSYRYSSANWNQSEDQPDELRSRTSGQLLWKKLNWSFHNAIWRFKLGLSNARLNSIASFLMAVDHCKSLHTICATTITLASVVHTVAHLMNVVNFSRNFDPMLSNLNMAEFKGQNPFYLLISVPGITGALMMIILTLMSLSSVDIIRNSSFDLFQIFHRLSVVFVILLFIHPASHVIKEQSNVDRHHPELCYSKIYETIMLDNSSSTHLASIRLEDSEPLLELPDSIRQPIQGRLSSSSSSTTRLQLGRNQLKSKAQTTIATTTTTATSDLNFPRGNMQERTNKMNTTRLHHTNKKRSITAESRQKGNFSNEKLVDAFSEYVQQPCLDHRPLFVAQSTVCWYVLTIGLSCYLIDSLLRKLRRSKNSIELISVRLDCEDNLIELILSNNHRRFMHWLPGQFVYLNCPQIAFYEWHPFTISSMDNESKQFSLHIKTGGDWTRKLRLKLEGLQRDSLPLLNQNSIDHQKQQQLLLQPCQLQANHTRHLELVDHLWIVRASASKLATVVPNLDCYNKMGQLQVECTKLVRINHEQDGERNDSEVSDGQSLSDQELHSISLPVSKKLDLRQGIDLYIDGPFHSPFERLLEQHVSVCIANGVGWTAFSSVFQCITNGASQLNEPKDWWSKWSNFSIPKTSANSTSATSKTRTLCHNENCPNETMPRYRKLSDTKLHLMVIVTSFEQFKPFYQLAINYFNASQKRCHNTVNKSWDDPIREITAFITRSSLDDPSTEEFCRNENLPIKLADSNSSIRINDRFTIQLGKPRFDSFLSAFSTTYQNSSKISVYCCGSHQVKKEVREICQDLNRVIKYESLGNPGLRRPIYSYHEENF